MPENQQEAPHLPVLLDETISVLGSIEAGWVVDATVGFGGHSEAVLERFPNARLLGLDQDESALHLAKRRLERFGDRAELVHSNFSGIKNELAERSIENVAAVIADLGVSSMQIDSETRGFSFRFDAPLDMRMDETSESETAAEILATRSETEIADIIYLYGEERFSRRIARRIVKEREEGRPIERTQQLAVLVASCVPRGKKQSIHPATKTFQALRIAVNSELEILPGFLNDSIEVLEIGGVMAVITFHSLEDRIVKNTFQRFAGKCSCPPKIPICVCGATKTVETLTKKPIVSREQELQVNPRSRSAKLRAVRKIKNYKGRRKE
jgi:16S rRNA (cytosine1402-N4)-methyltransferase